jgi:hypothetical protein
MRLDVLSMSSSAHLGNHRDRRARHLALVVGRERLDRRDEDRPPGRHEHRSLPAGAARQVSERGEFHFEATIGADKWEMTFSFGSDTAVPHISRLDRVFSEGESALRHTTSKIGTFGNLSDVARIKDAIHPYTEPLSDAIEALKGIAQTPRVSVGISASGPGTAPPAPGTEPRATAITATLTIHF